MLVFGWGDGCPFCKLLVFPFFWRPAGLGSNWTHTVTWGHGSFLLLVLGCPNKSLSPDCPLSSLQLHTTSWECGCDLDGDIVILCKPAPRTLLPIHWVTSSTKNGLLMATLGLWAFGKIIGNSVVLRCPKNTSHACKNKVRQRNQ